VIAMPARQHDSIEYLPVLSRGKHRRAGKAACFMEFASYLAGERWSDHPRCTHPLLAALARRVNDLVSDESRQRLVSHVPEVIGLAGSDLRMDVAIALRAARTALPVVAEELQFVMAAAVLNCERLAADLADHPVPVLSPQSADALGSVPVAAAWAERHAPGAAMSRRVFRRQTAPAIVQCATEGIAQACVPDPDRLLIELFIGAVHDCRSYLRDEPAPVPTIAKVHPESAEWRAGCR
jgi:hypothetical protein